MRTSLKIFAIIGALAFSGPLFAQERILVGGAGGMIPVAQDLAKAYQAKHPAYQVEIIPNSLGSTGGIKAVEAGRVAIGLTGRAPRAEEKGQLVHRVVGHTPIVFAVPRGTQVDNLTESQVCDIFAGKIRSWREVGAPDSGIVVLTRNEDDTDKETIRKKLGCFKNLKEHPEAVMLTKSKDMSDMLSNHARTIGLTNLGAVLKGQGQFKAVAIDGVSPSQESMRTGRYKLYKEFGVVTLGEPRGPVKQFLEFIGSADGERILSQNGVVVGR